MLQHPGCTPVVHVSKHVSNTRNNLADVLAVFIVVAATAEYLSIHQVQRMAHDLVRERLNFLAATGLKGVHLCCVPSWKETSSQKKDCLLTVHGFNIRAPGTSVAAGEGLIACHKAWVAFKVTAVAIPLRPGADPLTVGDCGESVAGRKAIQMATHAAGAACVQLGTGRKEHAGSTEKRVVDVVPRVGLARGRVCTDCTTLILSLNSCYSTQDVCSSVVRSARSRRAASTRSWSR